MRAPRAAVVLPPRKPRCSPTRADRAAHAPDLRSAALAASHFVCDGAKCKLVWFKKKGAEKKAGALKLAGCRVDPTNCGAEDFSFTINTEDGLNDLQLKAKSEKDKTKWLEALELIVAAAECVVFRLRRRRLRRAAH